MPARLDHVVVGAGVLGLSVTRELARRGREVLCLEQDRVGNEKAGSKGTARIFRYGYPDSLYVRLAKRARRGWDELEREIGVQLIEDTGMLTFGGDEAALVDAMAAGGAVGEIVAEPELAVRFPAFVGKRPAVYEATAGVLRADAALASLRRSAAAGRVVEGARVTSVRAFEDSVEVESEAGSYVCDTVVICAGAWSRELLGRSGVACAGVFRPTLQQVAYYRARPGDSAKFPAFVESGVETYYGLADVDRGLYKVGTHDPGATVHPAEALTDVDDLEVLRRLSVMVSRLLPWLVPVEVGTERCFYDNTPDEDFVVDRVGRLVIGAGTSGHGFKFGPALGEVLADLALGCARSAPIDRFSIKRFGG